MKVSIKIFLVLFIAHTLTSCKKEEVTTPVVTNTFSVIHATDFETGKYVRTFSPGLTYEVEINGNAFKRTLKNTINESWIWEGTLNRMGAALYKFNYEYSSTNMMGTTHIANMEKTINAALCFKTTDATFFTESVFEKMGGDTNSLEGKYSYYERIESSDNPSFNDTIYHYADFNANGTIRYYDSKNNIDTTLQWKKDDLSTKKIFLLSTGTNVFLINKNWDPLYTKQ